MRAVLAFVVLLSLGGCVRGFDLGPEARPPAFVLGDHVDDYELAYEITPTDWVQRPGGRYRILHWRTAPDGQTGYLIAQNDSANATDAGLWTRIDWLRLDGMEPYLWAFCLSTYDAPTQQTAEASDVADTDAPRTGCNGYPFSRMRRP